jgi:hypothetical protein
VRRSKRRLEIANHNLWLERLVQPFLFDEEAGAQRVAVFFVTVFSGSLLIHPEAPVSIEIVVPDTSLRAVLFNEPVDVFVRRYAQPAVQEDNAKPRLKKPGQKRAEEGDSE